MRKYVFLLILTCLGVQSISQGWDLGFRKKKSIEDLLKASKNNLQGSPLTAATLAQEALAYSQKYHFTEGEAQAWFLLAQATQKLHDYERSAAAYQSAATYFEKTGDQKQAGLAYNAMATIFIYSTPNYPQAIRYCYKAYPLLQQDSLLLQNVITNMAALDVQANKLDDALTSYKRVFHYWTRQHNAKNMAVAANNMATVYEGMKDYASSIHYYKIAIEINKAQNELANLTYVLLGISQAYCKNDEHHKSRETLAQAMELARELNLPDKYITAQILSAEDAAHCGDIPRAIKLVMLAQEKAETHHMVQFYPELYSRLAHLYAKEKNYPLSQKYERQYKNIIDSLATQERLALHDIVSELSKSEAEIGSPSYDINTILISGSLLACVILIVVLSSRKKKTDRPSVHSIPIPDEHKHRVATVQIKDKIGRAQQIEVIYGEGTRIIPLNSIWWLQKSGKHYYAFIDNERHSVKKRISQLESTLPKVFFRINRSTIINLDFMSNYSFWENHKYIIRMKDNNRTQFIISRNRIREMKELLHAQETVLDPV